MDIAVSHVAAVAEPACGGLGIVGRSGNGFSPLRLFVSSTSGGQNAQRQNEPHHSSRHVAARALCSTDHCGGTAAARRLGSDGSIGHRATRGTLTRPIASRETASHATTGPDWTSGIGQSREPNQSSCFLYPAPGALVSVGPEARPSGRILIPVHLFPLHHNGELKHVAHHTGRKMLCETVH